MRKAFAHGGDIVGFVEKYGRRPLDFSSNINPLGMPKSVKQAYINAFDDCTSYPDHECRALRKKIAEQEGVDSDYIVCGNGAADLIFRLVYSLKPKNALLPVPSFAEYGNALAAVSAHVHHFYLHEEYGFTLTNSLLDAIVGKDILFLCNPNNPTGCVIDRELLYSIIVKCRASGCVVVLDECFLEFTNEPSAVSLLHEFSNLVVIKAFTKLYAMPAMRLGYLMAHNCELLNGLLAHSQAWSVSTPALACGVAALEDTGYLARTASYITEERAYLKDILEKSGAKIYGSSANYIFFHHELESLAAHLAQNGILIRDCSNYEGLSNGYYRIAVRTHADNVAFAKAMQDIFNF